MHLLDHVNLIIVYSLLNEMTSVKSKTSSICLSIKLIPAMDFCCQRLSLHMLRVTNIIYPYLCNLEEIILDFKTTIK